MKERTDGCVSIVPNQQTACQRAAAEANAAAQEEIDGHPIVGVYIPQCDHHGSYLPLQSHGSTGHRWCVDEHGREVTGTNTPPGKPDPDCSQYNGG